MMIGGTRNIDPNAQVKVDPEMMLMDRTEMEAERAQLETQEADYNLL
jgi:hypothetical protein